MISSSHHERKSLLFFLVLVLATAAYFFFFSDKPAMLGLVGIFWGFFGFFRLIYLSHGLMQAVPRLFNLPIHILFGSDIREQEKRKLILKRLACPDVVIWLAGSILFILWALYNGFFPLVDSSWQHELYAVLTHISCYGILITLIFIALTYSQKPMHVQWGMALLGVFSLIGCLYVLIWGSFSAVTLPDISYFKGVGFTLTGAQDNSMLVNRFIALGSIGAYGLYALAFPALVMFIKNLKTPERSSLKPLLGMVLLVVLLFLDMAVVASDGVRAVMIIMLALTTQLWGHTLRYKI